ncbi:Caffeic acid 3-O-methyltransferase [Heracleum sosnowskyi]|uniref:Caffeic acid 3-O-methyltransferase n=1 Tax=Heracleum sosnowskyi TaxID=360622 RepID=A0AAD8LYU0_9APIA|nr:Caffeic acid 3-O-methyltransferase [Heracleum sosnowskyi]KAK1353224.1 Caffeic acid 3-O-methyltransferase [Heracleum sosnowskyi]
MSKEVEDANEFARVLQLNSGTILGMVMKAAIELDLFEIMAKAASVGGTSPFGDDAKKLSSDDIVAHLPTQNPAAEAMLERILRFLAANSILIRTVVVEDDGKEKSLYSLASICKHYIADEDGVSLAPLLLMLQDKVFVDSWYQLKDAVLEGGIPFNKAHDGMHAFEYPAKDGRYNDVFNQAMYDHTTIVMKKILEVYNGFEEMTEIIDVAGGTGATLAKIIAKYPQIRGINFDLPHVIKNAAPLPGVEHVEGDMFESVPKGEVIFMKWILHDWSDEHCLKLLRNCCNALPEFGKVVIVESVVPKYTNTGSSSKLSNVLGYDMALLALCQGGKERSLKEFEALAKQSGFAAVELICNAATYSVLEFYKKV